MYLKEKLLSIPFGMLPFTNPELLRRKLITFNPFWDASQNQINQKKFLIRLVFQSLLGCFLMTSQPCYEKMMKNFQSLLGCFFEECDFLWKTNDNLSIPFGMLLITKSSSITNLKTYTFNPFWDASGHTPSESAIRFSAFNPFWDAS